MSTQPGPLNCQECPQVVPCAECRSRPEAPMSEEEQYARQSRIIEGQKRRAAAKAKKTAMDTAVQCGTCVHWRELSDAGTGRCFAPLPDSLIDYDTRVMGYWNGLECPCGKAKR